MKNFVNKLSFFVNRGYLTVVKVTVLFMFNYSMSRELYLYDDRYSPWDKKNDLRVQSGFYFIERPNISFIYCLFALLVCKYNTRACVNVDKLRHCKLKKKRSATWFKSCRREFFIICRQYYFTTFGICMDVCPLSFLVLSFLFTSDNYSHHLQVKTIILKD